ncbi:hypothetical protein C0989_006228, partial [Termitomyces sp. Mn162]
MHLRQTISSWFSSSSSSSSPTPADNQYGLSSTSFADLLAAEYPAIHSSELVHLDHAASPPPPISAVTALTTKLSTSIYSNPHSHAPTRQEIDYMRSRVMHVLFCLDQREQEGWDLVWTSGTSASLKLVAESFPWSPRAKYRYLKESHTSLVGVRGCALAGGAEVESLTLDAFLSLVSLEDGHARDSHVLHAYPAQCNVTGSRLGLHPALSIARDLKKARTKHMVLVDAAAYLSTSPLDLSTFPYEDAPDLIVGSFYKIYGHPTGLGFLLVKRSSAHLLTSGKDTYFGGGAIEALSVSSPYWVRPRGSKDIETSIGLVHERFENGTIPYLSIITLGCAIDAHQRLFTPHLNLTSFDPSSCLRAVSNHTRYLANLTRKSLASLKHWDDTPLVHMHRGEGSERWEDDGPTIAFTLYTPSSSSHGHPIGHSHLLNLATLANIQLRTGGLCNTGVLARVSGLSDRELLQLWQDGRVCGDAVEFGGQTHDKPLGLVRISFGACSSVQDVYKFIEFLQRYFLVSKEIVDLTTEQSLLDQRAEEKGETDVYLKSLFRYPIKSCAGESLTSSRLTPHGLLHDREFAIVNSATGKILSQKQCSRMVLIRPSVCDNNLVMKVNAPEMPELIVPLKGTEVEVDTRMCSSVFGSRISVEADEWVSKFLEVPCQLHRFHQPSTSPVSSCSAGLQYSLLTPVPPPPAPILFSNESPFTLISTSSVDTVSTWVQSSHSDTKLTPIHSSCFRANFILSSPSTSESSFPPFLEDMLTHLRIGTQTFQVLARCRRCLMICVDPETG